MKKLTVYVSDEMYRNLTEMSKQAGTSISREVRTRLGDDGVPGEVTFETASGPITLAKADVDKAWRLACGDMKSDKPTKIAFIKRLREVCCLNLKDAKYVSDTYPMSAWKVWEYRP